MAVPTRITARRSERQRKRRAFLLLTGSGGAGLLAWYLGLAAALFSALQGLSANAFGSAECFRARVASVQSGELITTEAGSTPITITAVDPSRSFVLLSSRSDSGEPPDALMSARLVDATTVTLARSTDASPAPEVTARWSVIEYACGVSVQRGSTLGNEASSLDVAVAEVPVERSFPLVSFVPRAATTDLGHDDSVTARLADSTTLRLESGLVMNDREYHWQVVTFDNPDDARVEVVQSTMVGASDSSVNEILSSPVDPQRTLLISSWRGTNTLANPDARLATATLDDPSTLRLQRGSSGTASDTLELVTHVIELGDGTTVQSGELTMSPGITTATVPLDPVTLDTSVGVSSSGFGGDLSAGRTPYGADDLIGVAQATFELSSSSELVITRDASPDAATFSWQVVQWGGPVWWNADYEFRQQVRVSTDAAVAAPDGYSIPLTIDHAQLVNDGLAAGDGSDLRVLYFDGTSWIELDRVLDDDSTWDAADTTVWFRTQDPIDSGQTDGSYWIYYGNDTPAPPLEDRSGVFLFADDFEDGNLVEYSQPSLPSDWYTEGSWSRRRTLTIDAGQVDAPLDDFPLLVSLTDPAMTTHVQTDGDDLLVALTDGTQLPHELVLWNDLTGELVMWVRVPNIDDTTDTELHLWFGNPTAPSQQNPDAVWDPGHDAVWHLEEAPTGSVVDSSRWDRDATAEGSMSAGDLVAGRTGDALDFDGVDDRLEAGELAPRSTGALTVSAWVDLGSASQDHRYVSQTALGGDWIWRLGRDQASGNLLAEITRDDLSTVSATGPGVDPSAGWQHVAMVWDGSNLTSYLDGVPGTSVAASGSLLASDGHLLTLGADPDGTNGDPLRLDEVRVASTARSAAWLLAEFRNQFNPGSFVSAGPLTTASWTPEWTRRKALSIDAAAVDAPLSSVVIPVELVDGELAAAARSDGGDLLVTGSDGLTLLPYWVESFDAARETVRLWVRVPSVSDTTDTVVYLYYGATEPSTRADRQSTWAGYDAVWPLRR